MVFQISLNWESIVIGCYHFLNAFVLLAVHVWFVYIFRKHSMPANHLRCTGPFKIQDIMIRDIKLPDINRFEDPWHFERIFDGARKIFTPFHRNTKFSFLYENVNSISGPFVHALYYSLFFYNNLNFKIFQWLVSSEMVSHVHWFIGDLSSTEKSTSRNLGSIN